MELLLDKIDGRREGREVADRNIVLQPELRIRNSTASPARSRQVMRAGAQMRRN
jgi:hypothetical protein